MNSVLIWILDKARYTFKGLICLTLTETNLHPKGGEKKIEDYFSENIITDYSINDQGNVPLQDPLVHMILF